MAFTDFLPQILATSAPGSFGAIQQAVKGDFPDPEDYRRATALAAVFIMVQAVGFAIILDEPDLIFMGLVLIAAQILVQEYAHHVARMERERKEAERGSSE